MRSPHRVVVSLLAVLTFACGDGTAPVTGAVRIHVATLGEELDTDGYDVTVDDGTPRPVQTGTVVITGLAPGTHALKFGGTAINCAASPGNRQVVVLANDTTDVEFDVTCGMAIGRVSVSLQLTGGQFDADGFTIALDQGTPMTGVRSFASLDSVRVGTHSVRLGGLAANCSAPQLERSVVVEYARTVSVNFQVTCTPVFTELRVQVSTSGADIDPDGYFVVTDDDLPDVPVGANASISVQKVVGRTYSVRLADVAPNCTVNGTHPRSVPLVEGQVADVAFDLSCAALATLRITVSTSGTDPDPNGYEIKVSRAASEYVTAVAITSVVVVPRLLAGDHTVVLQKVAANCDATDDSRMVTLVGGGTTDISFDVSCVAARQIAFTKGNSGNYDIWLVLANGTGELRLTTREQIDAEPTWSPDGARIAFRSERDGNSEIYVMSSSGADQTRLTNSSAVETWPRWSPLGGRIAFVSGLSSASQDVFLMDPDGTNVVNITNASGVDDQPAWSPDGGKIAFRSERAGNSDIWVMDADGSNARRLTTTTDWDGQPSWSPDGSRIAFVRGVCDPNCRNNVMIMNADGSGVVRLTSILDESEPAWSPDGQRIMFMSRTCDEYYYYYCSAGTVTVMKSDGGGRKEIVAGDMYNPVWRP